MKKQLSIWAIEEFLLTLMIIFVMIWSVFNESEIYYYQSEAESPYIASMIKYISNSWIMIIIILTLVRLALEIAKRKLPWKATKGHVLHTANNESLILIGIVYILSYIIIQNTSVSIKSIAISISLNEPILYKTIFLLLSISILYMYINCKKTVLLFLLIIDLSMSKLIYWLSYYYINGIEESPFSRELISKFSGVVVALIYLFFCVIAFSVSQEKKTESSFIDLQSIDKKNSKSLLSLAFTWLVWTIIYCVLDVIRTHEISTRTGWESNVIVDGTIQELTTLFFLIIAIITFIKSYKRNKTDISLLWWYCFALSIINKGVLSSDIIFIGASNYYIHFVNPDALFSVASVAMCSVMTEKDSISSGKSKEHTIKSEYIYILSLGLFFLQWISIENTSKYSIGYQWIVLFYPPVLVVIEALVLYEKSNMQGRMIKSNSR